MKILKLLEGTIKVPEELINQIMAYVCSDVFSRAVAYLSDPDTADEYYESERDIIKLIAKYRKICGDFDIHKDYPVDGSKGITGTARMSMRELDNRYFKQNRATQNKAYALYVIVHAGKGMSSSGEYTPKRAGSKARVQVITPNQSVIEEATRSPELFDSMLYRIRGVVNHELMHAVQDMALNQMSDEDSDSSYYNDDGTLDDDKYYTHPIEFSPQIVSTAHEFLAFMYQLENVERLTPEEKKQFILSFVDPNAKAPRGANGTLLPFFATLYRKDKVKWKKAAKYFYSLVYNRF